MKTSLALALALLAYASTAFAQNAAVVQRLVQYGQMSEGEARALVRKIDQTLAADAERGGDRFDSDLRRAVHAALYGDGPPPRAEYYDRIRTVLESLRSGLDEATLTGLFRPGRNAAVLCAHRYSVTMGDCDALLAAATSTPAPLPYLAPDDGRELERVLRRRRVPRRVSREIVRKLRETMLGVPRNLTRDQRGRGLLRLLESCPGGVSDREAQVRAWHVGPTPGLAECIAGATASLGGAEAAAGLFGMSQPAAEAFVVWGGAARQTATAPTPPPPSPPRATPQRRGPQVTQMSAAEALRQQARAQYRLRNYSAALSAYESAAQMEPDHAGTWAGIGATKLALRDFAGAITAYQQAVALDEGNAGFFVALGRAFAQNGQRDAAIAALQQAMRIDRDNAAAREGLRALGGEPPPPPLPEVPPRNAILSTMQPLRGALMGCAPGFSGRVSFNIKVRGETGEVIEVTADGAANEDDAACMESVVQSARFPRFTREELSINYPFVLGEP